MPIHPFPSDFTSPPALPRATTARTHGENGNGNGDRENGGIGKLIGGAGAGPHDPAITAALNMAR